MIRRHAVALLLVLVSATIFGQSSTHLAPRHVLLAVSAVQGSGFTQGDVLLVARSLHQRLGEADPDVVFVEPAGELTATEDLVPRAQDAGADSWVQLTLSGDWSSARLQLRAFDLLLRSKVADLTAQRLTWGSPGGLSQETWADVAQAISGKFPMLETSAADNGNPRLARLTISALPGSTITGLGSPILRVGPQGNAFRELAPRREYSLRIDLPGYTPVSTRIFLGSDREVQVRQVKSPWWGLEGALSDSRAPGIDASVYFPGSLFVRYGFSTYAIALAFDSSGALLFEPLTNLEAQFGTYLSPEDRFFRFYLAGGGFVRIVTAPGAPPLMDALSPGGLRVIVGTESPVSSRGKLYLELTPTLFQTSQPDAFRAALGQDSNPPGWIFVPQAALNLLSFRVGFRWRP
jgi:hypothetical protein